MNDDLTESDFDALHRELAGIIPEVAREDLPNLLQQTLALEQVTLKVEAAEIYVEVAGGIVSRKVPRLS